MKIRTGFISNSSSSSFLIYGVYLETDELIKHLGIKQDTEEDDVWNDIEKSGLGYYPPCDSWNGWYLGESLEYCKDDQTMGDFKKQVRDEINSKLKDPIPETKFGIYEEEWYS